MARKTIDPVRFAEIYNDIDTYPTLPDVAIALGVAYQSVRNFASVMRKRLDAGEELPALIDRRGHYEAGVFAPKSDPRDHAHARARSLASEVTRLVTRSRYPLVNPEAIIVESTLARRYDRKDGSYKLHEGTPRTWLSDTLRVKAIPDCRGRRFLFTGAQNDAPVHRAFWANLKAYARRINAEIVVGPWTYETQWWSENNPTARSYDDLLAEHLCFGQMAIGDTFVFCGEMNTLPTADSPVSNLQTYSRGRWAVFPHAKLQLKTVPSTDPRVQAHQVMTSGACTVPKVIPRKAGVRSIFHHVIGATLVEFDADGDIFCRQIDADEDGSFYDLDLFVSQGRVRRHKGVRAIVFADLHRDKLGPVAARACFGLDLASGEIVTRANLLDELKPEEILFHDLFDNQSANHHHIGDNAYAYEMAVRGRVSVLEELKRAADFLKAVRREGTVITVVESNHDLGLERYVREGRYRNDGVNIRLGLQLEDAYLAHREKVAKAVERHESPPSFSLLEFALRQIAGDEIGDVRWVHDGHSHLIDDIESGHHGFRGANGAKGTVAGFARLGRQMSIGDKHAPEINEGVYVAGSMELQHGYNKGPSGWCVTHIVHYPNRKRTLLTMQKGKYRAGSSVNTD